jgi:SAM-dependent methyltransferase
LVGAVPAAPPCRGSWEYNVRVPEFDYESLAGWATGAQALALLRGALEAGLLGAMREPRSVEQLSAVTGRGRAWVSAVCGALEAHGVVTVTDAGWVLTAAVAAMLEEDAQQTLADLLVGVDARVRVLAGGGVSDGGYRELASSQRVAIGRGLGMSPLSPEARAAFARMATMVPELAERWRRGADHLEVGCGVGNALLAFAVEFPRLRVEGIELDAALIAEAQRRAGVLGVAHRVRLRRLDAADLRDEERFDSAQWSQMFFSKASRAAALQALHRALRHGALLFMPTLPEAPQVSPASSLKRALIASWDVPIRPDSALRAELEDAGFDVLHIASIEPRPLLLTEGYAVARRPYGGLSLEAGESRCT